ncbi:MAG: DUF998 domain-containing protein [Gammaproteobacteria bacterium]|nr:DUF998 domain-containing protein [Gammaproteobacteria bacterium]MDP2347530.1 DUF998 domain-containing protein [Gammaproteobacteria bacterium]
MFDRIYRLLAVAAVGWFFFAFILLHIVRDDLSLWHTTLSIYAVGPAGWVLNLGFYAIALAQAMIACRGFERRRSMRDCAVAGLLLVAAGGAILVGLFPHDMKLPHNTGAVLQLGLFPISLLLRAFWLKEQRLQTFNAVLAVLCAGAFLLLLLNDVLRTYAFYSFGLFQKAEIICIAVWSLGYAWYMPGSVERDHS